MIYPLDVCGMALKLRYFDAIRITIMFAFVGFHSTNHCNVRTEWMQTRGLSSCATLVDIL